MRRRPWDRPNVNRNLSDSVLAFVIQKLSFRVETPARRFGGDVRPDFSGTAKSCQRDQRFLFEVNQTMVGRQFLIIWSGARIPERRT